jgi:hypothetical protein
MPCCLIVLVGLFIPRLTIFFLWFFTHYISRAFQTSLWPLLGFFFFPYMTLAYAVAINQGGRLDGVWLLLFILGVLLDFGIIGGGARTRMRRRPE